MANWGKIYCSTWWGDESNKNSIPDRYFAECDGGLKGCTPPTILGISEFAPRNYRIVWTNTTCEISIQEINIHILASNGSTITIFNYNFDPIKPTSYGFALSPAGDYAVKLQYSDPINGLGIFSNSIPFTVI